MVGEIEGVAGDDDDGGGSGSGSGSGSSKGRVDVAIDRTTMSTELKTSNPIMVTVTGSEGFSGNVALTATAVDASDVALPGWTVELTPPSVTLAVNGTATAVATVKIPARSTGLAGTVKITSSSAAVAGTPAAAATVTAMNQVTFSLKVDPATGKCTYPADAGNQANPVTIALGTKVRFFNTGAASFEIHSGGPISHQGQAPNGLDDPVTEASSAYEQMPTGTGAAQWYCHAPPTDLGATNNPRFIVQ